ncbi:Hypp8804 [Branchiostoma lanceolatum]|uniref:Hypp8804 protein n=1 Tax=Branchiostoma lanceolatum TaxID=7740 RepID=A0A8J9Z971_BRALA|nr:Hypp8804 [Branchiostoma lanceolatum]
MAKCCSNCWYDRACWFFGLFTSILGGISIFFGVGALLYWNNPDLIDEFAIPIWVGVFLICIGGLVMANNKCRRWEDINKEYLEELELQLISEESQEKPVKRVESFTRLFKSRSRLSIRSEGKTKASQSANQERDIFERLDSLRKEKENGSIRSNKDASRQGSPASKSRRDEIREQTKYELLDELEDQQLQRSPSLYSDLNCLTEEDMNKSQNKMRNKRFKPIPDYANEERNAIDKTQHGNECYPPDDYTNEKQPRDKRRGSKGHRKHHDTNNVDEFEMLVMDKESRSTHSSPRSRRGRHKSKQGANNDQEVRHCADEIPLETGSRRAKRRPEYRRSFSEGHGDTGSVSDFNHENTSEKRLHNKRNSTTSLGTNVGQHHTTGNFLEVPRGRRKKRGNDLLEETWQPDSKSLPGTPKGRRKAAREEPDIPLYSKSLPGTPEGRRRIPNPLEYHDRLDSTTINFYQKPSRVGEVKQKSPSQRSVNSMAEYQKRSLDKFMIPAFMEHGDSTVEPDYFTTASLDRKKHRARHRSQPVTTGSSRDRMDSRRRSIPDIIISQEAIDGYPKADGSVLNIDGSLQFASPNTYDQMAVRPKKSTRAGNISAGSTTPSVRSPRQSPVQRRRSTAPALAGLESLKTYRDSFEAEGYSSIELEADIYEHMVRERMRKFKGNTTEPKVIFPTRKRHRTAPAVSPTTRRRYFDDMQRSPFFGLQDAGDDMDNVHTNSKFESRKQSLPPNLDRRQRRTSGKHRRPSIPYLESYSSDSEGGEETSLLGSRVALNSRGGKNSRTVSPTDSLESIRVGRTGSPPESKMAARGKKAKHHGRYADGGLIVPEPRKKRVRSPKLVSDMYETSGQENSATESDTFPPTTWETETSTGKRNNDVRKTLYSEEDEIRLLYNSNNEDAPYVKNNDGKVGNSRAHVLLNDDKEGVMVVVVKKRDT